MNRSAVTSPNPTPLPLRSINHRVFHFFFMRVREPPKGILRVFVQFQFILPTKKNKTKEKTSIQKYAEAMWWGSPKRNHKVQAIPFLFVYCPLIFLILDRSVGWKIETEKKNTKKNKKSEKRRPQTLASLPWSLKTTRHDHEIDTNSIWRKLWSIDGRFHSKKGYTTEPFMPGSVGRP